MDLRFGDAGARLNVEGGIDKPARPQKHWPQQIARRRLHEVDPPAPGTALQGNAPGRRLLSAGETLAKASPQNYDSPTCYYYVYVSPVTDDNVLADSGWSLGGLSRRPRSK